jgi:hypothetical protein
VEGDQWYKFLVAAYIIVLGVALLIIPHDPAGAHSSEDSEPIENAKKPLAPLPDA